MLGPALAEALELERQPELPPVPTSDEAKAQGEPGAEAAQPAPGGTCNMAVDTELPDDVTEEEKKRLNGAEAAPDQEQQPERFKRYQAVLVSVHAHQVKRQRVG